MSFYSEPDFKITTALVRDKLCELWRQREAYQGKIPS
jgi:hypothetical protein